MLRILQRTKNADTRRRLFSVADPSRTLYGCSYTDELRKKAISQRDCRITATTKLDAHLYLEKIFSLRLHLSQLSIDELERFVSVGVNDLKAWLRRRTSDLQFEAKDLMQSLVLLGRRATPRMVERILRKARFLLRANNVKDDDVNLALLWLCMNQAYPETRRAFLNVSSKGSFLLKLFKDEDNYVGPARVSLEVAAQQHAAKPWYQQTSREALIDGNRVQEDAIHILRKGLKMYNGIEAEFVEAVGRVESVFRKQGLL